MTKIAIIGGTGLDKLPGLAISHEQVMDTPFGAASAPAFIGSYGGKQVIFLARHGSQHQFAPHQVNYRANIWSLKQLEVTHIVAVAAVGGIKPEFAVGDIVIPDQLIDYTWGRESTFFSSEVHPEVLHVDFSYPYCDRLRQQLIHVATQLTDCRTHTAGVYGVTQGPRLETAAEIARMARDGCDIVGMTAMPEAVLARELELCYACCAIIANPAAGLSPMELSLQEIEQNLATGMQQVRQLLAKFLESV